MSLLEMEMNKHFIARISFPFINVPSAFCRLCKLISSEKYTFWTGVAIAHKLALIIGGSMVTFVLTFFLALYLSFYFIINTFSEKIHPFLTNYTSYCYINTVEDIVVFNILFIILVSTISMTACLITKRHFMACFGVAMAGAMALLDFYSARYSMKIITRPYYTEYLVDIKRIIPYFVMIITTYWVLYKDLFFFLWKLKPKQNDENMNSLLPERLRGKVLVVHALGHYIEVITEYGRTDIRASFSEALKRLRRENGLKIHRSYWVNREIIGSLEKQGNRFFVRTCYGNIPVSPAMVNKVANLVPAEECNGPRAKS
ncbi:LytTR family transcriptional regulator [Phyllobacterium salinisoli]|uniref:LytTR family transcriptional regulator n=1 Tax=Phyllobacterium salinisoli TaxID=1899321 RepID=A0A368JW32_9HYPH|nr:LytTR family DNA-binding domain-containing protein [Phyllobacterium salinisoli]RCS21357.1 LytTR family transcriptional regulator [Phyllobacterium salinisoli]